MGFGAAQTRAKSSPMLLVASVPVGDDAVAALAAKSGADALLLPVKQLAKERGIPSRIAPAGIEIPWGVSLETVNREGIEQLIELGCDFVVFNADKAPATVLSEERIGTVLHLDPSLSDSLTRTVSRLTVDAVFLSISSDDQPALTVQQLMVYQRLVSGAGKHVLAAIPEGLPVGDLESLWELGVRGVVVDMATAHPEERLSQVKEAIQRLPTTEKKKRKKVIAIVPIISEPVGGATPEEEEEDDEEEES